MQVIRVDRRLNNIEAILVDNGQPRCMTYHGQRLKVLQSLV